MNTFDFDSWFEVCWLAIQRAKPTWTRGQSSWIREENGVHADLACLISETASAVEAAYASAAWAEHPTASQHWEAEYKRLSAVRADMARTVAR